MDICDHLKNTILPKIIIFTQVFEARKNDTNYDVVSEFRELMFDISDEETSNTMIDGIINGDGVVEMVCVSEQIKLLFNMLFPNFELTKIEFNDDERRRNFISYE